MFACHSCERPWGHLKFGASSLMQELSPHSCFSPKPQQDPVHGWRARRDAIQEMPLVPDVLILVTLIWGSQWYEEDESEVAISASALVSFYEQGLRPCSQGGCEHQV